MVHFSGHNYHQCARWAPHSYLQNPPSAPFLPPSKMLSTSQALTPPSQPPPSSLLSTGINWVLLHSTPVSLGEMGLSQHILKVAWWTAANCLGEMLSFQGSWVPSADFTPSQCGQCLSLRFFWYPHRGEGRRLQQTCVSEGSLAHANVLCAGMAHALHSRLAVLDIHSGRPAGQSLHSMGRRSLMMMVIRG